MAIYDLSQITNTSALMASIKIGDRINIPYQGKERNLTMPIGTYKFECWGGKGYGDADNGGYSVGEITFNEPKKLYFTVGGNGVTGSADEVGGYNGGGNCYQLGEVGGVKYYGGGGATHIATRSGLLENLSSYKTDVLIVAGGSGAQSAYDASAAIITIPVYLGGGAGGGETGANGKNLRATASRGGTQEAGGRGAYYSTYEAESGTFGRGGSGYTIKRTDIPEYPYGVGGGGAGWYGGGGGLAYDTRVFLVNDVVSGGAGGSGYVSSELDNASTTQNSERATGYITITVLNLAHLVVEMNYNGIVKKVQDMEVGIKQIPMIYKGRLLGYLGENDVKTIGYYPNKCYMEDTLKVGDRQIAFDRKIINDDIIFQTHYEF